MNIRAISLGVAASVALFSSSVSFSQEVITFEGCRAGGNGMDKIAEHREPAFIQKLARTRRGDNGGGNGGESWDAYAILEGGVFVELRLVCIRTADEDAVGTFYVVVDGAEPIPLGPVGAAEFDPLLP